MTQNMAGRKKNTSPMQKKLMKLVDLRDAASFLDRVYLGCTQRECKTNESILNDTKKKCSNDEYPLAQLKSYLVGKTSRKDD